MNPYFDIKLWKNLKVRIFKNCDNSELVWHKDLKDRLCVVLRGKGWQFQIDNTLPVDINVGDSFVIQKMMFHRVIKGSSRLIILIKEFEHEPTIETSERFYKTDSKTNINLRPLS